jgi:chloramphenicol 3-O-phosphotransferase
MVAGLEGADEETKAEVLHEMAADERAAVEALAAEEEKNATIDFVREQRDALVDAARATLLFHRIGGLVTREQVEQWRAITGDSNFSAQGLHDFVQRQMEIARVLP